MKEKTPLSHEVVCVQMVDFETSSSKSEVSKSNSWKIPSFSKTMALQREPFLTMFYTINLSPLLVTKKCFMLIIFLSNYQQFPHEFCIASSCLQFMFNLPPIVRNYPPRPRNSSACHRQLSVNRGCLPTLTPSENYVSERIKQCYFYIAKRLFVEATFIRVLSTGCSSLCLFFSQFMHFVLYKDLCRTRSNKLVYQSQVIFLQVKSII